MRGHICALLRTFSSYLKTVRSIPYCPPSKIEGTQKQNLCTLKAPLTHRPIPTPWPSLPPFFECATFGCKHADFVVIVALCDELTPSRKHIKLHSNSNRNSNSNLNRGWGCRFFDYALRSLTRRTSQHSRTLSTFQKIFLGFLSLWVVVSILSSAPQKVSFLPFSISISSPIKPLTNSKNIRIANMFQKVLAHARMFCSLSICLWPSCEVHALTAVESLPKIARTFFADRDW